MNSVDQKPPQPILEYDAIDAGYGPIQALRQVSLHVNPGEIVTLIGANGAGKSTLMMSLYSHPRINRGQIRFKGQDISNWPTHEIPQLGIALVPEGRRIFPKMTVEENLIMGTYADGGAFIQEGLAHSYQMFSRLKERRLQSAGTLSGGEQQMLAICRGLMSRPTLLLLDEPSLGLAPIIVKQIFATLKEIANQGVTIFLVEQNASKALSLADRGYVLVNGEITLQGTGRDLLANAEVQAAYLGH